MIRLSVLGGFALEVDGGNAVGHLPQRRAEAVLAFLAVAGDRGGRRERLISLLWPDSDDDRGRHSLRDALHAIRQTLGADAIASAGADLRLTAIVESDVHAFQQALAGGRLSDAVDLYHGPLLDGFHLDHSAEFEHWIEVERGRLQGMCAHAIERLAIAAEQDNQWRMAAHWWMRAEDLDPFSTPVVVCRMRALVSAGDRPKALVVGEAHRQRLLKELELEPDAGFMEELAQLRNRSDAARAPDASPSANPVGAGDGEPTLDKVFVALKDSNHRAVVEQLSQRPASLCTLERFLALPQPEVEQYLKALESSGLVSPRQEGRVRRYRINLAWLRAAERWFAEKTGSRAPDGAARQGRRTD